MMKTDLHKKAGHTGAPRLRLPKKAPVEPEKDTANPYRMPPRRWFLTFMCMNIPIAGWIYLLCGLDRLDEGFQALFNRVRDEINNNKAMYTEEIAVMKKLITEVTELGAKIEVQEAHNKVKVEAMFRRERQEHKEAKRSVSMAKSYYQNMSKVSNEPQFMDTKQ